MFTKKVTENEHKAEGEVDDEEKPMPSTNEDTKRSVRMGDDKESTELESWPRVQITPHGPMSDEGVPPPPVPTFSSHDSEDEPVPVPSQRPPPRPSKPKPARQKSKKSSKLRSKSVRARPAVDTNIRTVIPGKGGKGATVGFKVRVPGKAGKAAPGVDLNFRIRMKAPGKTKKKQKQK